MRKIFAVILSLLCLTFQLTAFAECENIPIADFAGYLTDEQYNELSEKIEGVRGKYTFDVAVYTEVEMSGDDAQSTADDIFDYFGYGDGIGADGMILYIASSPRVYHFSTHGSGEEIFNDNGLAYIEEQVLPYLKNDDYYTAIKVYAERAEELLEMAANGEPFNEPYGDTYGENTPNTEYICIVVVGALVLPLLLALFMTWLKQKKMKTAVKNDYAANYMKPGSMRLDVSRDIFLYSTVVKTERPKPNQNGGGSGGHISSSGQHHGGRGGSY